MKRKKTSKQKRVSILTLGCAKNVVDSERLIGLLKKHNLIISYNLDETDAIIVNTCGFIKPAKEESIQSIMEAVGMKEQGLISEIVVIGCLSERYKKELQKQIPAIDSFFGIEAFEDVLKYLSPNTSKILKYERQLLTPKHYAYLKIAEGCNHSCGFCAIPLIKGDFRSTKISDLVKEAKKLVKNGVRELNIIAQDTTYYGIDLDGKRQIANLMRRLATKTKAEWIRLMYTYPTGFPENLLDVINDHENICKYVDIPLQHISDNMLKPMKRGISKKGTLEIIDIIRSKIENVAIRSAFIVGFPNESEKDFQELYDFIAEYKLDRVGVFIYSHEENTPAYIYEDNIPEEIKNSRRDELMNLQSQISLEKNKNKIGKTVKVLIDDKNEGGLYLGRTEHDAPDVDNGVIIYSEMELGIGTFINVIVQDANDYDLIGIPIL